MTKPRAVIDAHVHIMPWESAKPEIGAALRKTQPKHAAIDALTKSPDAFIERLDQENIERACLINYVAPEVMGFTPAVNEWVHAYTKGHRDRLAPVGGLHPKHTTDAKADVEKLVHTYELSAIKLHPVHSLFHVNDYKAGGGALRTLYEVCEREKVPIIVHTGTSIFPGARNRYGDPMLVDDVAVDYPDLRLVLAHCGRPLWMETAIFLARRHANVSFDISGIPPRSLLEYIPQLERLADKAVFGSDWPGPMIPSMRGNADEVATLSISEEAKAKILHDNAKRLYR